MTSYPKTERPSFFSDKQLAPTDAELVRACVKGDEDAWSQLVARYQRLVYAVPTRAGLNEEQAKDVFQDVFLTLFEKISELERPEKVRAWIVTTAKFKTWAVVRSKHDRYSPATDEEMEAEMANLPDTAPLAADVLVELEQQHLIRMALHKVGEPCNTILSMIYMTDPAASYTEVAEAIGVGQTSISPMRSRCLGKLEKILST